MMPLAEAAAGDGIEVEVGLGADKILYSNRLGSLR